MDKVHRKIKGENVQILDNAYSQSAVITSFSIFDSFLSDLTRFLLLMHPNAIPKDRQVKISEIVTQSNLSNVLDSIVNRYVHELSYRNVTERIQYLSQTFGIDLSKSSDQIAQVQEYAELRNRLIHDTSLFRYRMSTNSDKLLVSQRSDEVLVTWEMAEKIVGVCVAIVGAIFLATSLRIFRREPRISFPYESATGA